jgi:predicted HicB family RNase H-like nuclease
MSQGYDYNKKYVEKYMEKLDEIRIRLPKGKKQVVKDHAESQGESVNAFINRAIDETMKKDKSD